MCVLYVWLALGLMLIMSWMVASVHFHIEISSLQMTYSEQNKCEIKNNEGFFTS